MSAFAEDLRHAIRAERAIATRGTIVAYAAFKPGVHAVALYRLARWCHLHRLKPFGYATAAFCTYVTGADLPPTADLGPGLAVIHPVGVVVAGGVRAGRGLRLHTGAVIGFQVGGDDDAPPVLGDDVMVGAGAKILGHLRVGDGAKIGANAVVVRDVPVGATAVGVPARLLRQA